jgi:hypothetical protein
MHKATENRDAYLSTLVAKAHQTSVSDVYSIVHVGGTRCGTSSTDHYMKIHARITLTVECIRTCIVLFLLYVEIQGRV